MPIYTKTGDQGETGLFGKVRLSKASPRIAAIGAIDELNAAIGVVRSLLQRTANGERRTADPEQLAADSGLRFAVCDAWLATIQSHLFSIGAELATPNGGHEAVSDADVAALEQQIDRWTSELPELTRFILPGGTVVGAELHRARVIGRAAERAVVALNEAETDRPVRPELLRFLNRLSDALFAAARWVNHLHGVSDTPWERKT